MNSKIFSLFLFLFLMISCISAASIDSGINDNSASNGDNIKAQNDPIGAASDDFDYTMLLIIGLPIVVLVIIIIAWYLLKKERNGYKKLNAEVEEYEGQ